jgi:hypothetical protein
MERMDDSRRSLLQYCWNIENVLIIYPVPDRDTVKSRLVRIFSHPKFLKIRGAYYTQVPVQSSNTTLIQA